MSSPFLLPEEIWELILNQQTDSKDAWNQFKAYPELDVNASFIQKRKHVWLFGLILPHLTPSMKSNYIKQEDILNCRLVSKRWSNAVDTFLEGQNPLRAFHCFRPQPQVPGQFYWNTKTYLDVKAKGIDEDDDDDDEDEGDMFPKDNHFVGGTRLDSQANERGINPKSRSPARFLQVMASHPKHRSPFLSRSVAHFLTEEDYPNQLIVEEKPFWKGNDLFTLLDKFGEHIWYYQMDFRLFDLDPRYIVQCLNRLPNMRSLRLRGKVDCPETVTCKDFAEFLGSSWEYGAPRLPYLETLQFQSPASLDKVGPLLITRYGLQIRKLQIRIDMWKPKYSKLFRNLAELEITDIEIYRDNDSFSFGFDSDSSSEGEDHEDKLKDLLRSILAPLLTKLLLKFQFTSPQENDFGSSKYSIEDDIFQWLKKFPNLQYLGFGEDCGIAYTVERETLSPEEDSIPSLKFLSIRTSPQMSYNFLRCLPSLQHLQLHVHPKPKVIDHSRNPPVSILNEIQTATMYNSNIWELIPHLRTITLLSEEFYKGTGGIYSFNREGYDYNSRKEEQRNELPSTSSCSGGAGDGSQVAPLRQDIIDFLQKEVENAEREERSGRNKRKWDSDDDSWDEWDWKVFERRDVYGWGGYGGYQPPFKRNFQFF